MTLAELVADCRRRLKEAHRKLELAEAEHQREVFAIWADYRRKAGDKINEELMP